MKLKYNFVINEVGDMRVAVAIGGENETFKGVLKMNAAGASILENLKNDITKDELIAVMAKEYPEESVENISNAVNGLVEKLIEAGIVE